MLRVPDLELAPDSPDRALLGALARRLEVSAGQVALAGSMAEYVEETLAVTPVVHEPARQQALTDRHLGPRLAALKVLLLGLRAELDPLLRRLRPAVAGKPYPLGQCREITLAVQARLADLDPAGLPGPARDAAAALRAFVEAGGEVRRAWGDLRGQYFQNALIVGALYVDAANDTFVVTKPPVEILPFAQADFRPVADYFHFARLAARYWNVRVLPNHLLPQLAPYLPLIQIGPTGALRLGPSDPYMLGLTLASGFRLSKQALGAAPLSSITFASLAAALGDGPLAVPPCAAAGREAALALCRSHRAERRDRCAGTFNRAVTTGLEVNRRLARLIAVPQPA